MSIGMRAKSWIANSPDPVFAIIYFAALRPLILCNYFLRAIGCLPDEWYWADLVGANRGYFTVPRPNIFAAAWRCLLLIILTLSIFGVTGCTSVEKTMTSLDYVCVDITIDTTVSDSGILGRGIVLPEGESLTAETVELLCEY